MSARELAMLEDNAGYNPQTPAEYGLKVTRILAGSVLTEDSEGNELAWTETDATSQEDFLKRFPKQVSMRLRGKFYVQED